LPKFRLRTCFVFLAVVCVLASCGARRYRVAQLESRLRLFVLEHGGSVYFWDQASPSGFAGAPRVDIVTSEVDTTWLLYPSRQVAFIDLSETRFGLDDVAELSEILDQRMSIWKLILPAGAPFERLAVDMSNRHQELIVHAGDVTAKNGLVD